MPLYEQYDAEIYDRVYASIGADIPFWQQLAGEYVGADGQALELACGTLRVLLPVAESGVRITGIDESPPMLAVAQRKLERAAPEVQARVTLRQGDMRTFELGEKFNLIYIPFNTFGLLLTPADQFAMFDAVRKHLATGGVFAFQVFMPDIDRMIGAALSRWQLEMDESFDDGSRVQRDNVREVDVRRQILSVTWRTKVYQERVLEREWVTDLQLSFFFPRELEHLLARAGYEIVHYWGEYDRTDFWSMKDPQKQLIVARPL